VSEDIDRGIERLVGRDHERARLRHELERQREAARRKDDFVAALSHELRDPLAAIALATDVLGRELAGGGERASWAVGIIDRHARQLRRLVDDLLELSRGAHGKLALARSDVDLGALVSDAVVAIEPRLAGKSVALRCELPEAPLFAHCDGARVRQVIGNLLDNAVKYTPIGGHIRVALASEGGRARLMVADDGIGMSPDTLARVFGMFEQASGADRPSSAGLGLGLALVRQLVELHGGTVEARSPGLGQGSELLVELPLGVTRRPRDPRRRPTRPGIEPTLRVLLVDDDPDGADLLGLSLRRLGHQVEVFNHGAAALGAARQGGCGVAILDLELPDMSGLELARRLRELSPRLPLVALTGFGDRRHRSDARQAGFDHYLLKPVDVIGLDRMLRKLGQLDLTR
jgi:CheY-like chemotaxis protein